MAIVADVTFFDEKHGLAEIKEMHYNNEFDEGENRLVLRWINFSYCYYDNGYRSRKDLYEDDVRTGDCLEALAEITDLRVMDDSEVEHLRQLSLEYEIKSDGTMIHNDVSNLRFVKMTC